MHTRGAAVNCCFFHGDLAAIAKYLLFCPRIKRWYCFLEEICILVQPYSSQGKISYFTGFLPAVWRGSFSPKLRPILYRKGSPRWEKFSQFQEQKRLLFFFLQKQKTLLPLATFPGREPGTSSKWGGEERKNLLSPLRNSVRWYTAWWSGQLSAGDGAQESHEEHCEGWLKPLKTYQQKQKKRIDLREGW